MPSAFRLRFFAPSSMGKSRATSISTPVLACLPRPVRRRASREANPQARNDESPYTRSLFDVDLPQFFVLHHSERPMENNLNVRMPALNIDRPARLTNGEAGRSQADPEDQDCFAR
jgi:hypothetical protein